jgi:NADH:ubiquinone oxidoreductase subunit F (NADH-binding)
VCARCSRTAAPRHAGGADQRPSGICIDATEFGRRIAFEDLPTAGAFTVFDASRDMFEVARNYAHFFAHESCGFCTPCRVGTSMLVARDGQDPRRQRHAARAAGR